MEITLKELQEHLTKWQGDVQKQIGDILQTSGTEAKAKEQMLTKELEDVKKSLNSVNEQMKAADAKRVPGLRDELKKTPFDFGMAIGAMYKEQKRVDNEPWKGAEFEYEAIKAAMDVRAKSGNASSGSAGGYLIPDEVTSDFIDLTIANMPLSTLGMNVIRGLVGDLPVPKKTGRTTAYMVGESGKPASSDTTYGQVTLRPKKAAAFTKQSNRLIYQSRGVSDKIVRDDLMYSMKKKIEEQCLNGTGANFDAKGLLQFSSGFTSSSVSLGANGGRFTIDDASKMLTDLECADELTNAGGKYGFLMYPRVKAGMKRERVAQYNGQTNGQPILPMNLLMSDKVLSDQLGYQIASTTLMPHTNTVGTSTTCSNVVFGDWNMLWMGIWRDLIIKVSDTAGDGSTGSALLDDQIYIVMFQEFDTQVMRETAFTMATGAETTESKW